MPPSAFEPRNPEYEQAVRKNFARQEVMRLLGARLGAISPGRVAIELPIRRAFTQQRGYVHAGILATAVDSAGGYAAYTLMPKDSDVLTVEFKINFLAPAEGDRLLATGAVIRAGRTLTICELRVESFRGKESTLCAVGTQTLYCLEDRLRPTGRNTKVRG